MTVCVISRVITDKHTVCVYGRVCVRECVYMIVCSVNDHVCVILYVRMPYMTLCVLTPAKMPYAHLLSLFTIRYNNCVVISFAQDIRMCHCGLTSEVADSISRMPRLKMISLHICGVSAATILYTYAE
jgi:hypothetical protein